jgi:monoamine oxidase
MARTPLSNQIKKILALARIAEHNGYSTDQVVEMHTRNAISRREALVRGLQTAAALPLVGMAFQEAMALGISRNLRRVSSARRHLASVGSPVVIIGAGTAGLTAAYRLSLAGIPCAVYEASNRIGGRMFTQQNFNNEGMFCERGGELVDTDHKALIRLVGEVGLEIQPLLETDTTLNHELYYISGKAYHVSDLVQSFKKLAQHLIADQKVIYGNQDVDTPTYKKPYNSLAFDNMTLRDYLYKKDDVDKWVLDLVNICYTGEYGRETNEQSAMNLIAQIGTEITDDVKLLGDSDECKRIKGGNAGLPMTLAKLIGKTVPIHMESELVKIHDDNGGDIVLTFTSQGKSIEARASQVISAIPFTILRSVEGIFDLGLSPRKSDAIKNLGYGTNSKIMTGYRTRVWRNLNSDRRSNGLAYTNGPGQELWETSRMQPGTSGIMTSFMGGNRGFNATLDDSIGIIDELDSLFTGTKAQFDGNRILQHWPKYRFTLGSYSCPLPGQYNRFIGNAQEPELDARFYFAGEHTSVDFGGFMNGAVASGDLAAKDILNSRGVPVANVKHKNG